MSTNGGMTELNAALGEAFADDPAAAVKAHSACAPLVQALIAERDALRQWRFECCEALGLSCAAGAEWTVDDVFRCVQHEESKIIADRDRLTAEVLRLQAERDAMAKDAVRLRTALESIVDSDQVREFMGNDAADGYGSTGWITRDGRLAKLARAALSPATKSPAIEASLASGTGSEVGR